MVEKDSKMFVHTADLHLSPRSASIAKKDEKTGRNIRDLDMEHAFKASIDTALALTPLPSAYVIAGDIFDTWQGSWDALIAVTTQFNRLISAGIEVLGIAGNHDTPTNFKKTPAYKALMSNFSGNDMVSLAYDEIVHRVVGDIEYVLVPHIVTHDKGFSKEEILPVSSVPYKVLVVHGVAAGDPSLKLMDVAKEAPIIGWMLDMDWDYIAFGHYHKPGWLTGREGIAAYSGSLENTVISGTDVCMERGPVIVDMAKQGIGRYDMRCNPVRKIIKLPTVDASEDDVNAEQLDKKICDMFAKYDLTGAIATHAIKGMTRSLYAAMPRRSFQSAVPEALYIKTTYEMAEEHKTVTDEKTGETKEITVENDVETALLPIHEEIVKAINEMITSGALSASKKEDIKAAIESFL